MHDAMRMDRMRYWESSFSFIPSSSDQFCQPTLARQMLLTIMKNTLTPSISRLAQMNWTVLAWAIGVPLPIVAIIALMRGCS